MASESATTPSPLTELGTSNPVDKAAAEDVTMADAEDDEVEEYDFSNEPDDEEEEDDGRDTAYYRDPKGAVVVDDDDEKKSGEAEEEISTPSNRPWVMKKDQKWVNAGFFFAYRHQCEVAFFKLPDRPINGDWQQTEEYVKQLDVEMDLYLEDFPAEHWILAEEVTRKAIKAHEERKRHRSMLISTYGKSAQPVGYVTPYPPPFVQALPPPHPTYTTEQVYGPPPPGQQQYYQQQQYAPRQYPPAPVPAQMIGHYGRYGSMPQMVPQTYSVATQHMHTHPSMVGHMGPPQRPVGRASSSASLAGNASAANSVRPSSRGHPAIKSTETAASPVADADTVKEPPYKVRSLKPLKTSNKVDKRYKKDSAAMEVWPWVRHLHFPTELANATWDDSVYDEKTLIDMEKTRRRNAMAIKSGRNPLTAPQPPPVQQMSAQGDSESDEEGGQSPKQAKTTKAILFAFDNARPEGYAYATLEDQTKAMSLGMRSPEELMKACEDNKVPYETCAGIKVCWKPWRKGKVQALELATFSIKDVVVTKRQLDTKVILTARAGERLIDFCPHLLFDEMLLRVCTETGIKQSDVQERLTLNGLQLSPSTITKRIGSALGQKQTEKGESSSDVKPWAAHYNGNVIDFDYYKMYFGKHTSNRGLLNTTKRKAASSSMNSDDADNIAVGPSKKRARTGGEGTSPVTLPSSESSPNADTEEEYEEVDEGDDDDNDDAVSVQSDTMLDEIED